MTGPVRPRILVTGPESNGTKMIAGLLERGGADVNHHSPTYAAWDGLRKPRSSDYDAAVIVVRDGYCASHSLVTNGHVPTAGAEGRQDKLLSRARTMQIRALMLILESLDTFHNVYIVTYEGLLHEKGALDALCNSLGLATPDTSDIGNANAKYLGGGHFRDQRESYERAG